MSHLTTPASTKTDDGAPGLTGTSPGQGISTDEVQHQSSIKQEPKYSHNHPDKSNQAAGSESQSQPRSQEEQSNSDGKGWLDVVTEPPVRASTPTPSGAPGSTGASPNQPFGGDELRDGSPRIHDHHKHNDHSQREDARPFEKNPRLHGNSSAGSKCSSTEKSDSKPSESGGSEIDPGVTASTKTPAGAVGPTGTAPMEAIENDGSRDDLRKSHVHHKHDSHHSAGATSSQKANEHTPMTPNRGGSATSSDSTKDSSGQTEPAEFDGPNASFSSDIGGKEDPGRVAEKKIFEQNAQRGDVGSMGVKQESITGGGQFDILDREEAA